MRMPNTMVTCRIFMVEGFWLVDLERLRQKRKTIGTEQTDPGTVRTFVVLFCLAKALEMFVSLFARRSLWSCCALALSGVVAQPGPGAPVKYCGSEQWSRGPPHDEPPRVSRRSGLGKGKASVPEEGAIVLPR
ncbi:hypothetical protein RRG08_027804 [Elysia crispata]|uniref:Uncharacterized protein n=1 Tax=Elysia crispata TaxID=231223 RepID=A0AAE0YXR3_9GAST|nr:hypothetical protein RRG08_027804 [Elysia crispata]